MLAGLIALGYKLGYGVQGLKIFQGGGRGVALSTGRATGSHLPAVAFQADQIVGRTVRGPIAGSGPQTCGPHTGGTAFFRRCDTDFVRFWSPGGGHPENRRTGNADP